MRKKTSALFIIACIVLTLTMPVFAANAELSVQTTSTDTLKPGDSFDVSVSVKDSAGLAAYLIYVKADPNVFSAKKDGEDYSITQGDFCKSGTQIMNANGSDGWQVLWFTSKDVSGSGELFTIPFIVAENAKTGNYSFAINYSAENTVNVNAEEVTLQPASMTLQVKGAAGEKETASVQQQTEVPENQPDTERETPKASGELQFSDVPQTYWAYPYIMRLANAGIVAGKGAGLFKPEDLVTRAEFVKIIAGLVHAEVSGKQAHQFSDVEPTDWFAPYVAWGLENGIVNGTGEKAFSPEAPITREQMAAILTRLCEKLGITLKAEKEAAAFTDEAKISAYAKEAVNLMQQTGLIGGYPDGTFLPQGSAKRSEASKVIAMLMDKMQG